MELFFAFVNWLSRFLLAFASIHFLSRQAVAAGYLPWSSLWLSGGVAYALLGAYARFILPLFNPWKHLPVEVVSDIRIIIPITDVPRDKEPMEWATKHQDHDMIRLRVPGGNENLFVISIAAIRDLLGTNQNDFIKPTGGSNFLARILGYGLILSEGNVHTRQRKRLTSSFRVQNIRALHDLMLLKTNILLKNMERANAETPEKGIDINIWASKVTLDIIGNALMSQEYDSLNKQSQPVNEAFGRLTTASPGATFLFMMSMIFPQWIVKLLPTKINAEISEDVATIRKSCENSLKTFQHQLKQGSPNSSDILASVVTDPEASQREIIDQMVTFLGAGHETTSTQIAWITHLLTLPENAHYQDKLREEIRSHPGCTSSPIVLESLPWLNAICEETLRLFPSVTSTARKAIRDTTLAGVRVPRGSIVTIFPWAINRLPKYWGGAEAAKFVPERWLEKKPDGSLYVNNHGGAESNYCNVTFLHGNRSCIGKGFAKAELRLVIAKLYSEFTVSRLPGDDGQVKPVGSITIKPGGGLFVTLKAIE